jgi:hypothetical protein
MRSGARGKWRVGVDLVSIGETDPTLAVRFPVQTCESFGFLAPGGSDPKESVPWS